MSPPSADQAATLPQPATDPVGAGTVHCRQILANLLDISNEMAEILAYQVRSQVDDPAAAQATVKTFATLSKSIRRTIMLHEKLGQPAKPRRDRVAARKKIIRDVEDAIEANAPAAEQETLHAELLERLDHPDLEYDIADRPIADIVTDIKRDLDVTGPDDKRAGKRRTPHDIAILNARAAQPPGAGPSEELLALLAAAPPRPRPAGRDPPFTKEELDAMDMKTLMAVRKRYQEM